MTILLSSNRALALLLAGLLALFSVLTPTLVKAQEQSDIYSEIEQYPDDVDVRLRLAYRLAWDKKFEEAEQQALLVIAKAPKYWDAHLLLARIAGWQKRYDEALEYLQPVLKHDPQNRAGLLLKLDILTWKEDTNAAALIVEELFSAGYKNADLYYRRAQIDRQRLRYLIAYQYAKLALELDPFHEPSKQLIRDTRLVTVYMSHEFEIFGFSNKDKEVLATSADESGDRFGYGLLMTGQVWSRSRLSASVLNTFRYRYQTVNNQIGMELIYRPTSTWDLTVSGTIGVPAEVVPQKSLFFSVRKEFMPWVDTTLSYNFDVLPWPEKEPAFLQRPALDVGVHVHEQVRLGTTYIMGLMHYCSEPTKITHSAQFKGQWTWRTISLTCSYGYGEEHDKSATSRVAQGQCENLSAEYDEIDYDKIMFGLIGIHIHSIGLQASWEMLRTFTLRGGYSLQLRMADSNELTMPAHIMNLGGSIWF
ncbi:MAG: hypothetical protein GY847_22165 [Proteobacteria bacterium]|nr:hypothetical protein [Pseudomonadota bacterium]